MKKLKISVITVSYNAVETIEETILSVINQKYDNIEYIIIDGGSTDGTIDIIKKYSNKITYWISEPDNGMYDGLVKGMKCVTGDICAYINADDYYQLYAFDIINEVFQNKNINWVTGINTQYNNKSQITGVGIPYKYRKDFIQKGIYGLYLPYIQQESTFWRTRLNNNIDMEYLKKLRYAGDFYLWKCFSKIANLDIILAVLSGFRKHSGQLSENLTEYKREMLMLADKRVSVADRILICIDKLKGKCPIRFNKNIISYDFQNNIWN